MDNNNTIDHLTASADEVKIMQSVDYDLWLIERRIRKKHLEEITFDFSYVSTGETTKVIHLDGLLEPENYMIKEIIGIINGKKQKVRFLIHQDYDILPLMRTCRVKGGKFLEDSGQALLFIRELE